MFLISLLSPKPNLRPKLYLLGRVTQREAKTYQTRDRCVPIRISRLVENALLSSFLEVYKP